MIQKLKQSFDYLPKTMLEERRDLIITETRYGWEIVMILFIDGQRYGTSHPISYEEFNSVAIDFEAYAVKEISFKMKQCLVAKGVIR
ncbi:hypothetical protein D3C87_1077850 [compost metagenome]